MSKGKSKKSSKAGIIILIILVAALIISGIFAKPLETFAGDLAANLRYSGSDEIQELVEKIGLTNYGRFIFGATRPEIEDRENFNYHCDSHGVETSTLGCYGGNRIYVYNVTADELAGIKESTAAHELMHAVWDRLSNFEKSELSTVILETYNNGEDYGNLKKELENYSEDELIDELHSRFATEVKNLPEKLENHYKKYFEDQDAVVVFYENYREPFEKLEADFENLSNDLDTIKKQFEDLEAEYVSRSDVLSAKIDEFNSCANTAGCFSSQATFNARRNELLAENSTLDNLYEELSKLVDEYNAKVDAYNNSILRGEELNGMINSNSKVKDL